ncbi:MAG: hypothetical protein ABI586_02975 [Candidatus Nanopelagicales bacterium]
MGDLLLLSDERRPVDGLVTQQLVPELFVFVKIDAQRRYRVRLNMELGRRPLHLGNEAPAPENRCGCRRKQQHQHHREPSGPLASQAPRAHRLIGPDSSTYEPRLGAAGNFAACSVSGSRGVQSTKRSSVELSGGAAARDTPRRKELAIAPKQVVVALGELALSPCDNRIGPEPLVVFPDVDLDALGELLQSGETNAGISSAHPGLAT